MNILYIDHYAGTPLLGMEYRPYYLAREWVRQGHRVTMLAAGFSHVRMRQPAMPGAAERREAIDGIDYCWLAAPRYRGNGVGRLVNIAVFLLRAWRRVGALAEASPLDAVIASSTYPMDVWVARRIARRAGASLVFEVHDLWPLSLIELSGMSPLHPFALLCGAAERTAYRDADLVVSMLPKVHAHMASRGLDVSKLVVVPNGVSPDEWSADGHGGRPDALTFPRVDGFVARAPDAASGILPAPVIDAPAGDPLGHAARRSASLRGDVADALARARAARATIVGYAGSMGRPNALDTLLDAAALLRDEPIRIVLVGDGHERQRLVRRIAEEALTNVQWLPPVPKAQVRDLLGGVDIAYLGWQPVPIYRFGIAPNKLMDYMMAAKPVLHSVDAGNDPVAESGCGISCSPGDVEAVAAGLRRLAALAPAARRAMGERGRAFVEAEHAYPVLARRFLDAMMRIPRRTPRG